MRRDISQKTNEQIAFRPFIQKALGNRLGFRLKDGRMKSLQYMHLMETEYNPDVGIILEFVGHRVTLVGRNLMQLYWEIESEECAEIVEQHGGEFATPEGECFIRQILWEKI